MSNLAEWFPRLRLQMRRVGEREKKLHLSPLVCFILCSFCAVQFFHPRKNCSLCFGNLQRLSISLMLAPVCVSLVGFLNVHTVLYKKKKNKRIRGRDNSALCHYSSETMKRLKSPFIRSNEWCWNSLLCWILEMLLRNLLQLASKQPPGKITQKNQSQPRLFYTVPKKKSSLGIDCTV